MSNLAQIEQRLERLEAAQADDDFEDLRLSEPAIAKRYNVCTRTIKNWRADPRKNFPVAEVNPNGRRYNWLSELTAI
jgi:hypothetical protein